MSLVVAIRIWCNWGQESLSWTDIPLLHDDHMPVQGFSILLLIVRGTMTKYEVD